MNLNQFAKEIADEEGKKQELSIAQIKEVLACAGRIMAQMSSGEMLDLCAKIVKCGEKVVGRV